MAKTFNSASFSRGFFIIPVIVVIAILAVPSTYFATKYLDIPIIAPKPKLIRPDSHQTNPKAKIKVVTFVDYECPPCADVHETIKKVAEKNPDKIDLVVRHRIGEGHENAELAANAAEAAADQGKFFEMNDKLLQNQNQWANSQNPKEAITKYAADLNMDTAKFQQDIDSDKNSDRIKTDDKDANGLHVNTIPATFINGKNVGYAPTEKELDTEIDFLKRELENIEDDSDYNQDPGLLRNILEVLILAGAPLIIIIGGLIVLGRARDQRKRAEKIRKRIDSLPLQKKPRNT